MLNHFNVKNILFLYFIEIQNHSISPPKHHICSKKKKIQIQIFFFTNTINIIAQYTAVFSTIAHLLLHNTRQFFSHCSTSPHIFLMVIEQFTLPIHSTLWCLNNWFEVLPTCVTLIQTLGVTINWYKQAIN